MLWDRMAQREPVGFTTVMPAVEINKNRITTFLRNNSELSNKVTEGVMAVFTGYSSWGTKMSNHFSCALHRIDIAFLNVANN